jgi:predicted dehydrogenase
VPVPEGLDYEFWLGPARHTPYTRDRCSNRLWWFISDYALGFIAGWGIHPLDIAAWGAGDAINCPVEIEGTGEFPTDGVANTATNWRITLKYAGGLTLNFAGHPRPDEWTKRYPQSQSHGTAFEGSEGWVHVRRGVVNSHPESLVTTKIGAGEIRLYESHHHVRNLLDCVRSGAKTVCPVDEAVRSETLCQVSEIAIRLKRKVKWDPKTERFVKDDEANRMLSRSMRSPWSLHS